MENYWGYLLEFIFLVWISMTLISKFTGRVLPRSFWGRGHFYYTNSKIRKILWVCGKKAYGILEWIGWFIVDLLAFFLFSVFILGLFFLIMALGDYVLKKAISFEFPPYSGVVILLAWFTAWIIVSTLHIWFHWRHKQASLSRTHYSNGPNNESIIRFPNPTFRQMIETFIGALFPIAINYVIGLATNAINSKETFLALLVDVMYYISYALMIVLITLEIYVKVKTQIPKKIEIKA